MPQTQKKTRITEVDFKNVMNTFASLLPYASKDTLRQICLKEVQKDTSDSDNSLSSRSAPGARFDGLSPRSAPGARFDDLSPRSAPLGASLNSLSSPVARFNLVSPAPDLKITWVGESTYDNRLKLFLTTLIYTVKNIEEDIRTMKNLAYIEKVSGC